MFKGPGVGTVIWLLPSELSRGLKELPLKQQAHVEGVIRERLAHIIMIMIGILKRPGLEHDFGHEVDLALAELADHLAELIEKPEVVH